MKPPTTPREMIAHLQHELSVANNWIEHHQNHVDDLIKENAALRRDVYQCPPTSENDYEGFKWNDACEELERENAALNHALNIAQTELRLNGCAKAADEVAKLHDAARKEVQP